MKTIFMTGTSTGLGKAAAIMFADRGWNVIATMRNPAKATDCIRVNKAPESKLSWVKTFTVRKGTSEERYSTRWALDCARPRSVDNA